MNESITALEEKIHRTIPLSAAMQFHIVELDSSHIIIHAPLEPNVNIHGTGFAGSIYSLGTLSAWALISHALTEQGIDAELVIAKAAIKYRAPVRDDIRCQCKISDKSIQSFFNELKKKKRARVEAEVIVGESRNAQITVILFASIRD